MVMPWQNMHRLAKCLAGACMLALALVMDAPVSFASTPSSGYWLVGRDGGVFAFGSAMYYGSLPGTPPTPGCFPGAAHCGPVLPVVAMASTADGGGYWLVTAIGQVFPYGNAMSYGSIPGPLNRPIVGMATTPDGKGYWLVGEDGGIFAFGDATYAGSLPGDGVEVSDIVGIAATADGGGYWLVGSDGGVFAFGNGQFAGSLPGSRIHPAAPIVGIASSAGPACPPPATSPSCLAIANPGYWLVGADGGIFAFGAATFYGSMGGKPLAKPVVGMAPTMDGHGYWLTGADGGVFSFGDAIFEGSLPGDGITVSDVGGIVATP